MEKVKNYFTLAYTHFMSDLKSAKGWAIIAVSAGAAYWVNKKLMHKNRFLRYAAVIGSFAVVIVTGGYASAMITNRVVATPAVDATHGVLDGEGF
jgi:hypothetical protein